MNNVKRETLVATDEPFRLFPFESEYLFFRTLFPLSPLWNCLKLFSYCNCFCSNIYSTDCLQKGFKALYFSLSLSLSALPMRGESMSSTCEGEITGSKIFMSFVLKELCFFKLVDIMKCRRLFGQIVKTRFL